MTDLLKADKVHFVGIGGIGISAIARLFLLEGKEVSGSDSSKSTITDELQKAGAKVYKGHKASNLSEGVDLVVYSIAVPADNPELKAARKANIPILTYPQVLGEISKEKFTIAVSGVHGKTTTTAMLADVFTDAGYDPTVIVGSILKNRKSNLIVGQGKYLIAEACEYRRSFLNLSPNIVVITNIDKDHLDYYRSIKDIQKAFKELVEKLGKDGVLVCDPKGKHMAPIVSSAKCRVVDYRSEKLGGSLSVPGAHNVLNAQAAMAVARELSLPLRLAQKSLQDFSGTWRRFEFKGKTKKGVIVYDDYAHHPTEIVATLRAAKEHFPESRVSVIFQPHLYSRTQKLLPLFAKSFANADKVVLLPVYAAREKQEKGFKPDDLVKAVAKNHPDVVFAKDFSESSKKSLLDLEKGDVLITMGAGDVYRAGERIISN